MVSDDEQDGMDNEEEGEAAGEEQQGFADDDLQRPAALADKGESPLFGVLVELFTKLENARGRKKGIAETRSSLMRDFFAWYRKNVGLDLHPVIRLLVPDRDRQRNTYGVKEKMLATCYVEVLALNKDSPDAQSLLNWKAPKNSLGRTTGASGDFSIVCYHEIDKRSNFTERYGKLSINQINTVLDDLARNQDKAIRVRIIRQLHSSMTPIEQKWLIRIVLKDLKISIRERAVLNALHPDAMDLFNVCSDLRRVCWTLYNPSYRLPHEDSTVKIMLSFRPMLCKRFQNDFNTILKLMGTNNNDVKTEGFIMDEKMDGERIQLHKKGEEFRYYSRKDKDYTYLYGASREQGSLTPYIADLIHSSIEEIILDGEMLAWDPITRLVRPFGTLKSAASDKSDNEHKARPVFKVFDVLYAKGRKQPNGQNLLSKKLSARREFIRRFTKEEVGRFEWTQTRIGYEAADVKEYLDEICSSFGEGLVIKHPKSTYVLNGREDTWIKVKPDYMAEMGEQVDLKVIGGFWGSGKRGGYFGSFFCGILDDRNAKEQRFLSFCKVGSGLNLGMLESIKQRTEGKWRLFPKDRKNPEGLCFGNEKPDEWIAPEDSFYLSIKATEFVPDAQNYSAGYCLRFPRIMKYDWQKEKTDEDCLKMSDFLLAYRNRAENVKRKYSDGTFGKNKARKGNAKQRLEIADTFRGADVSSTEVVSDIFKGITFWILEGNESIEGETKHDLEKLVYANGGDYLQRIPNEMEHVVVCGRIDFITVQEAMKKGESIISPSWVLRSVKSGSKLPFKTTDFVHANTHDRAMIDEEDTDDEEDESDVEAQKLRPIAISAKDKGKGKAIDPASTKSSEHYDDSGSTTEDEDTADEGDLDRESTTDPIGTYNGFAQPGMGSSSSTMHLQTDITTLFSSLYVYLDTYEAALQEGINATAAISCKETEWQNVASAIENSQGTIVSLTDPRLTHVIVQPGAATRATKLFKLTPKVPRLRRFVTMHVSLTCTAEA